MFKQLLGKITHKVVPDPLKFSQFNNLLIQKNRYSTSNRMFDTESTRLVWIDLEMTGLDVDKNTIMEVACLVTDTELNIVAEAPNLIINQSEEELANMNEWCIQQHGKTGLTEACRNSKITLAEAENTILEFLKKHVTYKLNPLAGNSVYMDKFFLMKHMPKVNDYLHYRIVDVSTIKELCRRLNNDVYRNAPKKIFRHRAIDDIKESVAELKYYIEYFFQQRRKSENS